MDYEKKYKEAIIKAKSLYGQPLIDNTLLKTIFPELAESEDEKIRKELIEHIKANQETPFVLFQKFSPENVIAWLEKQCTVTKDTISMDVNSETEWDDIHKFLRMNLDGEKVKLLIIREE